MLRFSSCIWDGTKRDRYKGYINGLHERFCENERITGLEGALEEVTGETGAFHHSRVDPMGSRTG